MAAQIITQRAQVEWINESETDKFYSCHREETMGASKARLSYMQIGTARFQSNFALHKFPFDIQVLKIRLFSDCSADHVRLVRNMEEKKLSLLAGLVFQNQTHEYEMSKIIRLHAVFKSKRQSSSATPRCALDIDIYIRRRPIFWLINLWFPLFTFTGLSFTAFAVEVTNLPGRLGITLTILLTLVAYRFAMMTTIPRISYMNWMDLFFQLCFLVVFAVTVHATALALRAEETLPYLEPSGMNTWSNPVPSWQSSQAMVGWVISAIWAALNITTVLVLITMHYRGPLAWLFRENRDTTLWFGLSDKHGWGTIRFRDSKVQNKLRELPNTLGAPLVSILNESRLIREETSPAGDKFTLYHDITQHPTHRERSRCPAAPGALEKWRCEDIHVPSPRALFTVVAPRATSRVRGAVHGDIPLEMMRMEPGSSLPPVQPQWLLLDFESEELARAVRLIVHEAFSGEKKLPIDEWRLEPKDATIASERSRKLADVRTALRALADESSADANNAPHAVCEMALPEYKYMLQNADRRDKYRVHGFNRKSCARVPIMVDHGELTPASSFGESIHDKGSG